MRWYEKGTVKKRKCSPIKKKKSKSTKNHILNPEEEKMLDDMLKKDYS
jgi:hypothetical protein